jgi:hypothetical protein
MCRWRDRLAAMARYPQGAGHWTCFLQYILGLRDLGHEVLWLDILVSTGTRAGDESRARLLVKRFEQYGLRDVCALLVVDQKDEQDLRTARAYGASTRRLAEFFRTADLLWNSRHRQVYICVNAVRIKELRDLFALPCQCGQLEQDHRYEDGQRPRQRLGDGAEGIVECVLRRTR